MRKLSLVMTGLFMSLATQQAHAADLKEYWSSSGWIVSQNAEPGGYCGLQGIYGNNTFMVLVGLKHRNELMISFSSEIWKSLDVSNPPPIRVTFLYNDKLNEGWGIRTPAAWSDEASKSLSFFLDPDDVLDRDDVLDDIAKSENIAISHTDYDLISAYELKGSGIGVAKLRSCFMELEKRYPRDPFDR